MTEISVIVPIYNTEQYLPHCLDSLLCQTFQDIEIICIDDVSTDRSLAIARSYAAQDPRIRVASLPVNSRQGAARNLGLQMALAPYIGFVDSDDFVAPNYFENLYRTIVHHGVDIVITPYTFVDQQGNEVQQRSNKGFFRHRRSKTIFERTLGQDWEHNQIVFDPLQRLKCVRQFMVMNKLYSSALIETIRFPENTRFEDVPFTMEAIHRARNICTIPDGGYFYRRHPESTTSDTDFIRFTESVAMLEMSDSYIAKSAMTTEEAEHCKKTVTDTLGYTIRALIRSKSKLSLNQIIQAKAMLPSRFFHYFLWRLFRKHLKTAGCFALIMVFIYWGYLWLKR